MNIASSLPERAMLSILDDNSPWALVFAQENLAIAVLDEGFCILRVNKVFAGAEGRSADAFLGRGFFELYPDPNVEAIFRAVASRGTAYASPAAPFGAALSPTRSTRNWNWSLTPVVDACGQTFLILMLHNLSQRIRAEENSRLSESNLRNLLHNLPGMAYRGRPDWSADLLINAEALTGYAAGEINAFPAKWLELVHGDDLPAVLAAAAGLRQQAGQRVLSYRIRHRTGDYLWVEDHKSSLFDGEGRYLGVEGMVFDISARVRSQAGFQQLFSAMSSGFALHEIIVDAAGKPCDYRFLSVNPAFEAIVGMPAADLLGRTVLDVLPGTENFWIARYGAVALSGDAACFEHYSGELRRHYRVSAYCPQPGQFAVIVDDVTLVRQNDERLRDAAAVFENTRDGVMITDRDARIVAVNRAFSQITGYAASDVLGRNPRLLQSGKCDASFYQAMWADLSSKGFWQGEIWNRKNSGEVYPEWLTLSAVLDDDGAVSRYIGVFTDVSRVKAAEDRVEFIADHDTLTGLPNRRLLNVRFQHAVERAGRHGNKLALLILDLDLFKNINDSLGHAVGDQLLVAIAERLGERLRESDTLARLGGDEFAVLVEELDDASAAAVLANGLLEALQPPFNVGEQHEIHIGASIGISVSPDDGKDTTLLMRNADAAVYLAKNQGRNTYRFYTEALTLATVERVTVEARLRKAIEAEHLVLHYQPLIEAVSGDVIGCEALVRWSDPLDGLIPPLRFIGVAEDSGLIAPLGAWVLRQACRQMKAWLDGGRKLRTLAVNVSPRQLFLQDVPALVRRVLDESGLPAHFLELEITEGILVTHGEQTVDILNRLRDIGVRLSIDDFGTGYSSLSYLKRFPIDKLKIDRSFVRDLSTDSSDAQIVAAIIAMAAALNLSVLAEGVETPAQLKFLAEHGCDYYQGYFFGRPVSAGSFPTHCAGAAA